MSMAHDAEQWEDVRRHEACCDPEAEIIDEWEVTLVPRFGSDEERRLGTRKARHRIVRSKGRLYLQREWIAELAAPPKTSEPTPYEEIRRLHAPNHPVSSMSDEDVAAYARGLDLGSGYSDHVIRQALRKISRGGAA